MLPDDPGSRVRRAREAQGKSRKWLALRTSFSEGHIRNVERGTREATSAFLGEVSKALGVDRSAFTGQPYIHGPYGPSLEPEAHAGLVRIRAELHAYDLDNFDLPTIRSMAEIDADVGKMCEYRRAASFRRMGEELPSLLGELRACVHRFRGPDRDRALDLLCELYYSSHSLAHKLGYADLAALAIERMAWAAAEADLPLWSATAQFHRAAILTAGGDWNTALAFLDSCRAPIEARLSAGKRNDLIAWGGLHLQSGLAAARSGRRALADDHLAEAQATALRVGDDRDRILTFGPRNTGIWGVALAVEALDHVEALTRASRLVIPPGTPKERVGNHLVDLSRADVYQGNYTRAMDNLQAARQVAPAQTRNHPGAREVTRLILRHQRRNPETVLGFAAWMNLQV